VLESHHKDSFLVANIHFKVNGMSIFVSPGLQMGFTLMLKFFWVTQLTKGGGGLEGKSNRTFFKTHSYWTKPLVF
jgi:hypothetical protein